MVLLAIFFIIGYDLIWTHFHQTGVWNFFTIIALLLIALVPGWIAYKQGHARVEQAYIDRIQELILKDGLRTSQPGDEVRRVADVLTATALEKFGTLGGRPRGRVLVFLKKSGLIDAGKPIINLADAPLYNMKCDYADLRGVSLCGAALYNSTFRWSHLDGADLTGARLDGANLSWASMEGANLSQANLKGAKLERTNLSKANLINTVFDDEALRTAFTPDAIMVSDTERLS